MKHRVLLVGLMVSTSIMLQGCLSKDPCDAAKTALEEVKLQKLAKTITGEGPACNKNEPLELRQAIVANIYYFDNQNKESLKKALYWAEKSIDTKETYSNHLVRYWSEMMLNQDDAKFLESSRGVEIVDSAARHGVKSAMLNKVVLMMKEVKAAESQEDKDKIMPEVMAWLMIGTSNYVGKEEEYQGSIALTSIETLNEITIYPIESKSVKTLHDTWDGIEKIGGAGMAKTLNAAFDLVPKIFSYGIDLDRFKKIQQEMESASTTDSQVSEITVKPEKERLADASSNDSYKPYTLEIQCEDAVGQIYSSYSCVENVTISYPGTTENYGMRDFWLAEQRGLNKFRVDMPKHFDLSVQANKQGANLSAMVYITDKSTGQDVYTGKTHGKFDVLRVEN